MEYITLSLINFQCSTEHSPTQIFHCKIIIIRFVFNCYVIKLDVFFVHLPTNAQLIDKLSHSSYMFRHTSMSNAVVGNII